jgi:hypothetical protein
MKLLLISFSLNASNEKINHAVAFVLYLPLFLCLCNINTIINTRPKQNSTHLSNTPQQK